MKKEKLPVQLSPEAMERVAHKLAKAEKSLSSAEQTLTEKTESWKGTRKALKAEVETCREEVHALARTYRDGFEEEEVEVDERIVDGQILTFRTDTKETLRTRPVQSGDQLTVPEEDDVPDETDADVPNDEDDPTVPPEGADPTEEL